MMAKSETKLSIMIFAGPSFHQQPFQVIVDEQFSSGCSSLWSDGDGHCWFVCSGHIIFVVFIQEIFSYLELKE